MKKNFRWILYAVYTLCAMVFFLFVLFPRETAREMFIQKIEKVSPLLTASVEEAYPVPAWGIRMKNVSFYLAGKKTLVADRVSIHPSLLSLLFYDSTNYEFDARIHEGTAEGSLSTGMPKHFKIAFEKVRLEKVPALGYFTSHMIRGQMGGEVDYLSDGSYSVRMRFEVGDFQIELAQPLLGVGTFRFDHLASEQVVENDAVRINICVLNGSQMDIIFSGIVNLNPSLKKSMLALTGFIKPHLGFLNRPEGKRFQHFFPKHRPGERGYSFTLKGTIDSPVFFWN